MVSNIELDPLLDDPPAPTVMVYVLPAVTGKLVPVQWGLWITHRKWCDFVLYCPQLDAAGLGYKRIRFDRDEDYIDKLVSDMIEFDKAVEEVKIKLLEKGKDK